MKQMLPSALHISQAKVLSQGSLDVLANLQKLADLGSEQVNIADLPTQSIEIQWSEVHSPRMKADFAEGLIANRLYSKNFQFFGKFLANGQVIAGADWQNTSAKETSVEGENVENFAEFFSTKTHAGVVLQEKFATGALFNCTWLLEFLIAPQACIQAGEHIIVKNLDNGFLIELQANNGNYREIEKYLFNLDFTAMCWQHDTIINR